MKIEALAQLGDMLKSMEKATGGDAQRTRFKKGTESPPTLKELGIDKKTSMVAQQLAVILSPARKKERTLKIRNQHSSPSENGGTTAKRALRPIPVAQILPKKPLFIGVFVF